MSEEYSGLVGAFPFAVRRSDSRIFRVYGVLGGLLAAAMAVFFALGVVNAIAATAGLRGGTVTFVRSVFVLFGFLLAAPVVAPVLFVARRHRQGVGEARYDTWMGVAGFGYVGTLFLGGVASTPPAFRSDVSGPARPLVAALYALPESLAWTIPLAGAAAVYLVHRRLR